MSSADSILLAAINNKIDFFEIKSLSDLEEISNGCLFTLLQSFIDPQISEKVEVSFLTEISGPEIKNSSFYENLIFGPFRTPRLLTKLWLQSTSK